MKPLIYLVVATAVFVALYYLIPWMVGTYLRYRGKMLVTCPVTRKTAAVSIDIPHSIFTAALGRPKLRVRDCSSWPGRRRCAQECVAEVAMAPEACRVETIVGDWYKGKNCIYCGTRLNQVDWKKQPPALMCPSGKTSAWSATPAEALPEVLSTHSPVCWKCHVTESFCRDHPELVIFDRRRMAAGSRRG